MRKLQINKYDYEKDNYKLPVTIEKDLTLLVIGKYKLKQDTNFCPSN